MKTITNFQFKIITSAIALVCTTTTSAGLSQEAHNALFDLPSFGAEVKDAKEAGLNSRGFFYKSEQCIKLVEKGKQLGVKDNDVVEGNAGAQMRFGEAAAVCEEHRRWEITLEAARYLHDFGLSAPNPETTKPGELGATYGEAWSKKGKECVDQANSFIAKGAYPDKKVNQLNFKNNTIRQSIARCEIMVGWGKKYAVDTEKAKKAKAAAIRSKYVKAGFKGQRLDHFIHYDNVQWKVAGCQNEDNLQTLRKAQRLFQWLEHNDGTYGIRKYVFKGDKVVSVTDDKYETAELARQDCK